jgi:4-hydroxy-3-methylbut-2-enyl diphosphate reductase
MHYDFHSKTELICENYLPTQKAVSVLITSGASCPDALVEGVIKKLAGFFPASKSIEEMMAQFQ